MVFVTTISWGATTKPHLPYKLTFDLSGIVHHVLTENCNSICRWSGNTTRPGPRASCSSVGIGAFSAAAAAAELPGDVVEAAQERGRAKSLQDVMAELLAELGA